MTGHEFVDLLSKHFRESGTAGREVVFLTEDGFYHPLDIEYGSEMETVVTLLEDGK